MTRRVGLILFCSVLVVSALAREDESLEQLIARANAASSGQQADLYLQVADREVRLAADNYKVENPDSGREALRQAVDFADKAHALILKSGKNLPRSEIKIRKIAARLRDLKQNVNADEQSVVQAAVDKLEGFRTELLKAMFGSKDKGVEKK